MERAENEEFDRLSEEIERLGLGLSSLTPSEPSRYSPSVLAVHYDRFSDLYWQRYRLSGEKKDFECCHGSSIAAKFHGDHIERTESGQQLGLAQRCALQASRLGTAFERFGDPNDLDKAITAFHVAASVSEDQPALHLNLLINQANYLCLRYEAGGPAEDIEKAIDSARSALDGVPAGKEIIHNDLSTMYFAKWEREQKSQDLDLAIWYAQAAISDTADEDPNLPTRLLNLANALCARYCCGEEQSSPQKDNLIKRAISALDKAVHCCGQNDWSLRVHALTKLARAYHLRFDNFKQEADIRAAIGAANSGLRLYQASINRGDRPSIDIDLAEFLRVCTREAQLLSSSSRTRSRSGHGSERPAAESVNEPEVTR